MFLCSPSPFLSLQKARGVQRPRRNAASVSTHTQTQAEHTCLNQPDDSHPLCSGTRRCSRDSPGRSQTSQNTGAGWVQACGGSAPAEMALGSEGSTAAAAQSKLSYRCLPRLLGALRGAQRLALANAPKNRPREGIDCVLEDGKARGVGTQTGGREGVRGASCSHLCFSFRLLGTCDRAKLVRTADACGCHHVRSGRRKPRGAK